MGEIKINDQLSPAEAGIWAELGKKKAQMQDPEIFFAYFLRGLCQSTVLIEKAKMKLAFYLNWNHS